MGAARTLTLSPPGRGHIETGREIATGRQIRSQNQLTAPGLQAGSAGRDQRDGDAVAKAAQTTLPRSAGAAQ
jgi:hypothetical protein